jgi:hypothetical protein
VPPGRDGANFLAFLKKAAKPHAGNNIHVVSDNLSIHGSPEVMAWLEANRTCGFTTPALTAVVPSRRMVDTPLSAASVLHSGATLSPNRSDCWQQRVAAGAHHTRSNRSRKRCRYWVTS